MFFYDNMLPPHIMTRCGMAVVMQVQLDINEFILNRAVKLHNQRKTCEGHRQSK